MSRHLRNLHRRRAAWCCLPLCLSAVGCAEWLRTAPGVCEHRPGAIAAPAGTYTARHRELMHARARENRFVGYQHEWFAGGDRLGPEGLRHVEKLAAALPQVLPAEQPSAPGEANAPVPHPAVVVERQEVILEPDESYEQASQRTDALNERRRLAVVEALARSGFPDADPLVVVGCPTSEHLHGNESPRVYQQFINAGNNGVFGQGGIGNGGGLGGGLGGGVGGGIGGGFGGIGGAGNLGGGFF